MNIGVLGTGAVGDAIATALIEKGHSVMMGSRNKGNEKSTAWVSKAGNNASEGTFSDAAKFGEIIFACLSGEHALSVIKSIDTSSVSGKILIDVTNPLDFSQGMPPRILKEFQDVSLAEKIQEALPGAHVVKALNTVNFKLMVDARVVNSGRHNLFLCGNDINAKNAVKHLLVDNFHWIAESLIDLGDIKAARCTEAIVPFWVLVWQSIGTPLFNFNVVH